jgi:hypothetical protein
MKTSLKNKKTSLLISSIIAILICLSPFLLYIHNLIPDHLENFETIFGTIKGGQFEIAQVFVYMLFNKFVPLFLLILLYITNKNWWSNVILIPIATYLFQLTSILSSSATSIDDNEFIYVIPITVIILTPLYFIKKRLDVYLKALDLKKEMKDVIKKKTEKQLK